MSATAQPAKKKTRLAPWLTLGGLVLLTVWLYLEGRGYYLLSTHERFDHPDFKTLKPSGLLGHGYGIVGTALIIANLLYLVRRRFAKFNFGRLSTWLDMHVLAGLVGAVLVAFHSTFQLRTPIATTTSISLAVLVATGAVGLYIYRLVPKAGGIAFQQRIGEVEKVLPDFSREVREAVGKVPCTRLPPSASLFQALITVPRWTQEAKARRLVVERAAARDPAIQMLIQIERERVVDLVAELGDLAASEIDSNAGAALMRSWRSVHGFMAILMVLSVTVHIWVAWAYGYRWIFS
ncbi:MAG: hypothetical protein KIT84_32115 [Labilithrix sp.]|nr:hypothetical protein [Labilithrix sp.]MCW5815718.1 hypothetical protein [Labilithrix sp.]